MRTLPDWTVAGFGRGRPGILKSVRVRPGGHGASDWQKEATVGGREARRRPVADEAIRTGAPAMTAATPAVCSIVSSAAVRVPRHNGGVIPAAARWVGSAGALTSRYGLALILVWIGGMKFTAYEAGGIRPFVENSPLMSWTYPLLGVQGMSNLLGVVEIAVGLLIAASPLSAAAGAVGSALAAGMFLTTLSFLATTPGVAEPTAGGFPAVSIVGQFLLKDAALLGVSLWSLGEALHRLAPAERE